MRFAEVVDSPESAKEFMEENKIKPREIIIVWDEDIDLTKSENHSQGKQKSLPRDGESGVTVDKQPIPDSFQDKSEQEEK